MDNDFKVQTRLTYKQKIKSLLYFLFLATLIIGSLVYRYFDGPEHELDLEDIPMRIKLAGEVIQVEEHRKYITVEIEDDRFEDSINILVYSPLREKLEGIDKGDILKVTGFKISRRNKRSYEAKKVKFTKAKPNIFDDV